MGRHKIQRRYRQKYSLHFDLQETTNCNKIISKPKSQNVETPDFANNIVSNIIESINISGDSSEFNKKEKQKLPYKDISPKMNARIPKLKLNFDIPENDDTENVETNKDNTAKEKDNVKPEKDLEKTLSVDNLIESDCEDNTESIIKTSNFSKNYSMNFKTGSEFRDLPRTELTSLNGCLQIPSSTFKVYQAFFDSQLSNFTCINKQTKNHSTYEDIKNTPTSFENKITYNDPKNIFSGENSNSFITKRNHNEKFRTENCCITIELDEKVEDISNITKGIFSDEEKTEWNISPTNMNSIELPTVSDIESKTETKFQTHILNNVSEMENILTPEKTNIYYRKLKTSLVKILTFCSWLAEKFIIWIRKGYKNVRTLISIAIRTPDPLPLTESEFRQVIALIKCENDRVLTVLSEKVSCLSQELIQVRISNEATLTALKKQFDGMQSINSQLVETNNTLFRELTTLQEKLSKLKTPSSLPPVAIPETKYIPPPPPPPPPPPFPPATKNSLSPLPLMFPVESSITTTPNSKTCFRTIRKTPTRKHLTVVDSRPVITAEDLLKVTLRKVSTDNSKDNRRNTIPGPRGPVISLDMLRNVKLKSARRRPLDQHMSPRSASRITKNRSQSNGNLSPIMLGAEESLRNLLKPSHMNGRIFKKTQFIATSNSETDLTKEMPPNKFGYH